MAISDSSQAALQKALDCIDFTLFGIMLWECVVTGWFDVEVITRRRPFKRPVIMYWITKYSSLAFILGVNVTKFGIKLNCQAIGSFVDTLSGIGIAGASCLLMLRAIALWARDKRVVIPLLVVHLGQWALNLHNAFIVREHWGDLGDGTEGCVFTTVTWPFLRVQFIYTMLFDFAVLALATYALMQVPGRSGLWKLLFMDGLSYFVVAFLCYLATTVVVFLSFSFSLRWIFSDTTNIFVAIAACRSFVRLATRVDRNDGSISIEVVGATSPPAPVRSAPRFYRPRIPSTTSLSSIEDAKHDVIREPDSFALPSVHFPDTAVNATRRKGDVDIEAYPDATRIVSPQFPASGIRVTQTKTEAHL